jgi:hypothetical protein
MGSLTYPSNLTVYETHQYLDSDGSGTSATCVSSTIGAGRIADATAWLKANGKKGVIGEFAGGANAVCEAVVKGMLDALTRRVMCGWVRCGGVGGLGGVIICLVWSWRRGRGIWLNWILLPNICR